MSDIETLQTAIRNHWPSVPGDKAQRYVGRFFNRTRTGTKIVAKVRGNHGDYTISIDVGAHGVTAACSCYIGKGGYCHHCLGAIRSSELRNHFFNELGATKLACLWVIEHVAIGEK